MAKKEIPAKQTVDVQVLVEVRRDSRGKVSVLVMDQGGDAYIAKKDRLSMEEQAYEDAGFEGDSVALYWLSASLTPPPQLPKTKKVRAKKRKVNKKKR